ncbi:mitochondrial amidoxime-reducing component 1-like [Penaeus japonicus]|uniref:mitochondrial amidoxime-reducing component 1-like n=1 Tax=Penaeus japonicus TaxID=27405 RepID=UPI001C71777B|nr:mitochondrial amidoxime-reducing component 1-like [Penaeus japonicus]
MANARHAASASEPGSQRVIWNLVSIRIEQVIRLTTVPDYIAPHAVIQTPGETCASTGALGEREAAVSGQNWGRKSRGKEKDKSREFFSEKGEAEHKRASRALAFLICSELMSRRPTSSLRLSRRLVVVLTLGLGMGALASKWFWQKCVVALLYGRKKELQFEEVGVVSQLAIHPLKSARGIPVQEGRATLHGLARGPLEDRSFLVVTSDGRFITGRQSGTLMTVDVEVTDSSITLKVEGEDDVQDLGSGGARGRLRRRRRPVAVARVLFRGHKHVRLLYRGEVLWDRPSLKPRYFEFPQFRPSDRIFYADTSSFMVASESSLDDLNGRLAEPVSMSWFRPNVVVRGARPFDEDDWAFLKIGDVVLRRVKPCERCLLTTIDPTTGKRDPCKEPLNTLQKYRTPTHPPKLSKIWSKKPIFGVNMTTDAEGLVRVGDRVLVARASEHPEYAI